MSSPGRVTARSPVPAGGRKRRKAKRAGGATPRDRARRRLVGSVVVASILVHLVALALFGLWVVARKFSEPEATFSVARTVKIPVQTPEHKKNVAAHEAMAPRPTFDQRLASARPTEFALPDVPALDLDQVLPLDPSELASDHASALVGAGALGGGLGNALAGAGGTGGGQGMRFFDIEDAGQSVVIMIDVSASMFGRTGDYDYDTRKKLREGKEQSFQKVRDEAIRLVGGLGPNSRFNVLRWSGSARAWKPELVPASPQNKAAAQLHIQESVDVNTAGPTGGRPGGTRHDYALEALLEMAPEVAFMITDGNATASKPGGGFETIEDRTLYKIISDAKKADDAPVPRVHVLYYLTGQDKKSEERLLRGIATRTGGKFRKVRVDVPEQ